MGIASAPPCVRALQGISSGEGWVIDPGEVVGHTHPLFQDTALVRRYLALGYLEWLTGGGVVANVITAPENAMQAAPRRRRGRPRKGSAHGP